ncbi:MAG TPA: biotin/lipoyl-binding protein [Bacillota bacterium]|nr:biotin/lipoyl-binding protein [Bacillota bacterium]
MLYGRTTQYGIITGTAQSIHHDVAPLQAARVKEICVQIGSPVTNGQVVAQLDTTLVDTQVAEAEAALAAAQSSMATYQGQMLGLIRTVEDAILQSQHTIGLQKNQQASDEAKLAQLKTIQAERDKLFKANLIPEQLADALRPEIAALEKVVAAYPAQIALEERILEAHRKQRADLQQTLHLGPEEDAMQAITDKAAAEARILETVLEMRKHQKEAYSLRAGTDGVVSDILLFPGVVAKAGESVVSIGSRSDLIIGYLPEFRLGRLKRGDHGYAFRIGHPAVKVEVVEMVPEINPIPMQLSPVSAPLGATLRSQKIVFRTEPSSDIMPGEKVQIRMESEWWAKTKRCLASVSQ